MFKIEPPNDIEIASAQKNDADSLLTVIQKTSPYVLNLCKSWCRPPLESEDVAQETLILIAKKLNSYESRSAYFTWVYSVTYRTFLDAFRKQSRREKIAKMESLDDDQKKFDTKLDLETENNDDKSAVAEMLNEALGKLSESHSQILILIDAKGESYTKVASDLGIPVGTVRSRLARARIQLRNEIESNGTNSQANDVLSTEETK